MCPAVQYGPPKKLVTHNSLIDLAACISLLTPSGVQNWDGTGGNGAAMRHFQATGQKYPLVVKLGTISPSGGDVFSYAPDENDMVTDAKLVRHLVDAPSAMDLCCCRALAD